MLDGSENHHHHHHQPPPAFDHRGGRGVGGVKRGRGYGGPRGGGGGNHNNRFNPYGDMPMMMPAYGLAPPFGMGFVDVGQPMAAPMVPAYYPPPPVPLYDENSADFCKALAKVAKPRPPWCIGTEPTSDINEEISRLENFLTPNPKDKQESRDAWEAIKSATMEVAPTSQMFYTGSNSWGFFPYRGRLAIAVNGLPNTPQAQQALEQRALFKNGCKIVSETTDPRGQPVLLIEHAETRREIVLRYGDSAAAAAETVRGIRNQSMSLEVRQALNCLIVLLRQSKIIDDTDPATLSDEATAVLVLSIANSYPDRPTPDRLLIDFFLTYGFKAHFDSDRFAVSVAGMVAPVAKSHTGDAIEIIDPGNPTRNLAVGVTPKKLQFMQSTFQYCYHVVSEFRKEAEPQNRRGQSPLSTIVGGEPFWPRVVELATLNIEPYSDFLNMNRHRAHEEAAKAAHRKATGDPKFRRGGGGGGNGGGGARR